MKQWGLNVWKRGCLEPWYGIKTVIRRSAKQLPQNPKLARFFAAIAADETAELGAPVLTAAAQEVDDRPSMPMSDVPSAPAAPLEIIPEGEERAVVTLPNWRNHPLAKRTLGQCSTDDLAALYSTLCETDPEGSKDLISHIGVELDDRRNAA